MGGKLSTLLRYELKSNSSFNKAKNCKGKEKKGAVGAIIGKACLYILLMSFVFLIAMLILKIDSSNTQIPVLATVTICFASFFFTLIKTNGYMFAYKEYDMLMSLPFKVKTIASAKFLYMYVMNLRMTLSIMVAAIVANFIFGRMNILSLIIWLVLSFFVPMIPMVLATALGSLATSAGGKFKYKRVVQIVLTVVFILLCFSLRFIIEWLFRTYGSEAIASNISGILTGVTVYYPPAYWLDKAISGSILYLLLFLAVSIGVFEIYFIIISKFYRQINSRLKIKAFHKEFKMTNQKSRGIVNSLTYKEFLRFKGSNNYLINTGVGIVMIVILSIVALFFDPEKIISSIAPGAPITASMIVPAIPFIVHFFLGMAPTTTVSYSLEGKNLWILKSLPITGWDMVNAKMRFNMICFLPVAIIANIILGLKFGGGVLDIILGVLVGTVLCAFSTVFGMLMGIKFPMLDWDNEIEPIKRSTGVAAYIIPTIFVTMGVIGGVIVLSVFGFNTYIIMAGVIVLFLVLDILLLLAVKRKAMKLW